MGRMLPTSPEPYEVPTLEEVDASAKEQVHQAAQFRALDEMLGLIGSERNFDEMYNAWWLPVVTSLYSGQESTWVIVAGERRKRDYRVQGVFFGPACADGFVGTLSFDGTRLRHDGSKHVFEVKFSTAFGAEFEPKTLTGFFHNYGSGNSYCEVQFSERDANAVIRRIREGTSALTA